MLETLAISESEYTYIWQELQRQQMVFHPTLAPAGRFNSQEFFQQRAIDEMKDVKVKKEDPNFIKSIVDKISSIFD